MIGYALGPEQAAKIPMADVHVFPGAEGMTRLRGAAELRVKESDRVESIEELAHYRSSLGPAWEAPPEPPENPRFT